MKACDVTAGELARAGVRIRFKRVPAPMGWMFEGLTATSRRALGVAIVRRLSRKV